MLKDLLREIRASETVNVNDLAAKLDVSPSMVSAMLETLERMGALRQVDECSEQQCQGCAAAGLCADGLCADGKQQKSRLWATR